MLALVVVADVGACGEVDDGAGDNDLVALGCSAYALRDMDGDSCDVIAALFDLTGVYSGAYW
jgi:hypothetical protein